MLTDSAVSLPNRHYPLLIRIVLANLDMAGITLPLTPLRAVVLASVGLGFLFDAAFREVITPMGAVWYAIGFFVVRQWFLLASFGQTSVATYLRQTFGLEGGGQLYECITALFFYHRSYSFSLILGKTEFWGMAWLLPYQPYVVLVAYAFIGLGLVVNTWSYLLIGHEAYYYLDIYYGRFFGTFSEEGPYRLFKNPMYGVGQLPAYGVALLAGSLPGLAIAFANQVVCYLFYYRYELPHIRRLSAA